MTSNQKPIFKPQVACPSCGELSAIDYCLKGSTYTWWCSNNSCGKQYRFVISDDWSVKSEPTGVVVERTKVTLKISPQKEDIFIVLKGRMFDKEHNDRYYYEEHTCPVNLIYSGIEVILGKDRDPHGLFTYVKTESL